MIERRKKLVRDMKRTLIIDGNAVYEIDEECMLKKRYKEQERGRENTEGMYDRGRKDVVSRYGFRDENVGRMYRGKKNDFF